MLQGLLLQGLMLCADAARAVNAPPQEKLAMQQKPLSSLPRHCNITGTTVGVLDEKASASQVLGLYAEAAGAQYAPHIQETLAMLQKMASYFHCQVREQAYTSLPLLFVAALQAFPNQDSGTLLACPGLLLCCS